MLIRKPIDKDLTPSQSHDVIYVLLIWVVAIALLVFVIAPIVIYILENFLHGNTTIKSSGNYHATGTSHLVHVSGR